jgi:hypothetical protein
MADIVRSILAADFGSVYTRAVLLDIVDGQYRMVARGEGRTTDGFPVYDLEVGFSRILRQMEKSIGRRLIDADKRIITPESDTREGVDFFAVSASLGRPMRAVVVGLVPDVSIESAIRATNGTYIEVVATVSLADGRDDEERLNAILLNYPDLVLISGGTENGAEDALRRNIDLVYTAVALIDKQRRPVVVFAGNTALQEQAEERFASLTRLFIADNVRPALDEEKLEDVRLKINRAYDAYKEQAQQSFAVIAERSQTGILPTAQGQAVVAEYLGKIGQGNVAVIDVGSAATTVVMAVDGDVVSSIRTDVGLGHSAPQLLDVVGVASIREWLPMEVTEAEIRNYAMNKSLRPGSLPMTLRDLYFEHGLLRAGVRHMIQQAHPNWVTRSPVVNRVILSGSALTRTGDPGFNTLLALDCLQPAGVTEIEIDSYGLLAAVGALTAYVPEAAVQLLEVGNLTRLGVSFSVDGTVKPEREAMEISIKPIDSDAPTINHTLNGGHVWVYPLNYGERAEVTVKCTRGLTIGGKRRTEFIVEGGGLGLLFDARGRTLPIGTTPTERAAQLPLWVQEVSEDIVHEIPAEWLEPLEVEQEAQAEEKPEAKPDKKAEKKRRGRKRGKKKQEEASDEDDLQALLDTDDDQDELNELRNVLS